MTIAYADTITSLDPGSESGLSQGTTMPAEQIFETLVTRTGTDFQPEMAESWSQPDDHSWQFVIREESFSDGTPVTSADVKASLDRIRTGESPLAPALASVDTIETPDDRTVVITTKELDGTLLSTLSLAYISPAAGAEDPSFYAKPTGSGPFEVKSFEPSQELVLVRNDEYWGEPAKLDTLTMRYIPEASARLTALENGEIQATWSVSPDQATTLEGKDGIEVESVPGTKYWLAWFNNEREPFTDQRVRQALWHAIDLDEIVKTLLQGQGEVMTAPIPPSVFGYSEQEPYSYDPELAKQLLAEAGYPNGFDAKLPWPTGWSPGISEMVQAVASYWSAVGVNVELEEEGRGPWVEDLLALNWDMVVFENEVEFGDADGDLARIYRSTSKRLGYANLELDALFDKAKSSTDQTERADLYAQACAMMWEDAPGVFMANSPTIYAYRSGVQNFDASPTGRPSFAETSLTGD